MTKLPKLSAQRAVIEDLAVVAKQPAPVGRSPRLHRIFLVDDPQPMCSSEQVRADADGSYLATRANRVKHLAERSAARVRPGD